jgi:hypothetical protein
MIFLIAFDRKNSTLLKLLEFPDSARLVAQDAQADLEFDAGFFQSPSTEIVLLEADSLATVQRTHRRYFEKIMSQSVLDSMLERAKPPVNAS